jgi:hypothetical protein
MHLHKNFADNDRLQLIAQIPFFLSKIVLPQDVNLTSANFSELTTKCKSLATKFCVPFVCQGSLRSPP